MLSSENPPPDLPCFSDKRASDKFDHNNVNPLLNFSVRDYVFGTRVNDIKHNWPFSQKNLQLYLKYRANDVLPPFQSPDSVKFPAKKINYSDGMLAKKLARETCSGISSVNPLKSPTKDPEFTFWSSRRVERNTHNTVKKCPLIVKSDGNLSVSASLILETMASKVCPVCKTFSSSSNTTLNAHIDQCLSRESGTKRTENSKVIKHRVKPRKTRLMVDVYETALHCTLEDLDRRNGTNWASNLGFPVDQIYEEYASINSEDINEYGDVYVDSNGTKLRILSKPGDFPSSSNANCGCGPNKLLRKGKGNEFLSSKKKKYLVQKEKLPNCCLYGQGNDFPRSDSVPKCSSYEQRRCYLRPNCCPGSEVNKDQQNKHEVCEDVTQPSMAYDPMKFDDSGMNKQLVGSERTDLSLREKINLEKKIPKRNSRRKTGMPSLGHKNPCLVTKNHKRKKNLLCSSPRDGCIEQPCSRKRLGISLSNVRNKNRRAEFSSFNVEHSGNDSSPNGVENHASSRNDKRMGIVSSKVSHHHTFSSEVNKKFSYLGERMSDFKKRRLHCKSGSGERLAVLRHDNRVGSNEDQMEKASSKSSIAKTRSDLEIQKKRAVDKGDVSLKGFETSPKSLSHESVEKNIDSYMGDNVPRNAYNVGVPDEFVRGPSYEIADGEAFVAFSKSYDSAFPGPTGPNIVECVSHHYSEQEMSCADEFGEDLVFITHNSHEVPETNTTEAQRNYYVDVDPIPIPGPPGSYLPSPGRSCSEELQGNSSLTTCRIQSSGDERDGVYMDSSDSPISAMPVTRRVRQNPPEKNRTNSSMGYANTPTVVSNDNSETIFTACSDCKSPTPSTSNPVLRLMGKNLMVVNKDENQSPQSRLNISQSSMMVENNPGPRWCVDDINGGSTTDIHNDPHSFWSILSGGPSTLENTQTSMAAGLFDCFLSEHGLKIPAMRATHSGVNPFYGYQTRDGYSFCSGSPFFSEWKHPSVVCERV